MVPQGFRCASLVKNIKPHCILQSTLSPLGKKQITNNSDTERITFDAYFMIIQQQQMDLDSN